MVKLLLDEHISPAVAKGIKRIHSSIVVHALAQWGHGEFLAQDDSACLEEACRQGLTFVTYDRRTVPLLLKSWGEEARSHAGVIFVDEKTIPPNDIGGLTKALARLWTATHKWNWTDRICFLQK